MALFSMYGNPLMDFCPVSSRLAEHQSPVDLLSALTLLGDIALSAQEPTISATKEDQFQANIDVQQFKPEEISVKVSNADRTVTIEGKHEEKRDQHGFISRHFVRKYIIPEGHNMDMIESKLSSDGVLSITAPKIQPQDQEKGYKSIPITRTNQPSKPLENKTENSDQKKEEETKNEQ